MLVLNCAMTNFLEYFFVSAISLFFCRVRKDKRKAWENVIMFCHLLCHIYLGRYKKMQKSYIFALLFGLLFSSPLFEFHRAEMHNGGNNLVDVVFLNLRKAQNVKGFLCSVSTRSTTRAQHKNNEGCVVVQNTGVWMKIRGVFKVIIKNTPFPIGDGDDKTPHIKREKKKKKKKVLDWSVPGPLTIAPSASACSSRPLCLNFISPMCITAAVTL